MVRLRRAGFDLDYLVLTAWLLSLQWRHTHPKPTGSDLSEGASVDLDGNCFWKSLPIIEGSKTL